MRASSFASSVGQELWESSQPSLYELAWRDHSSWEVPHGRSVNAGSDFRLTVNDRVTGVVASDAYPALRVSSRQGVRTVGCGGVFERHVDREL